MPRWTPEARLKQAEIQKTRQSWRLSTGPKTPEGKARSSRNSLKHGLHSARTRRFKRMMRLQRQFLAKAKAYERRERIKRRFALDVLEGKIPFERLLPHALSKRPAEPDPASGFKPSYKWRLGIRSHA